MTPDFRALLEELVDALGSPFEQVDGSDWRRLYCRFCACHIPNTPEGHAAAQHEPDCLWLRVDAALNLHVK